MRLTAPTTVMLALVLTGCTDPTGAPRGSGAPPPSEARVTKPVTEPDGVEPATPVRESLPCPAAVQRELVGRRHGIVGHSFVWPKPLRSPPLPDRHNKILWQLQRPGRAADAADLLISASLNGSATVVHRRVEGHLTPGSTRPSIVDVPKPGCWTFSLTWGRERDVVSVRYRSSG